MIDYNTGKVTRPSLGEVMPVYEVIMTDGIGA